MTTLSAAVSVSPRPPTCEVSSASGMDGVDWNRSTRACLSSAGTLPSMRTRSWPSARAADSSTSSIARDWLNTRVL